MPTPRLLLALFFLLLPAGARAMSFTFSDVQKAPCQQIAPKYEAMAAAKEAKEEGGRAAELNNSVSLVKYAFSNIK